MEVIAMETDRLERIYHAGFDSVFGGLHACSINPWPLDSPEYRAWNDGANAAESRICRRSY